VFTYAASQAACEDMVEANHRYDRKKVEAKCQSVGGSFAWIKENEWERACFETNHSGWAGSMLSNGVCCGAKHAPHETRLGNECEDMEHSSRPMKTVFSRSAVGNGSSEQSCLDAKVDAKRNSLQKIQQMRSECQKIPNSEFFESDAFSDPDMCWAGKRPVQTDFASIFIQQGVCCQRFALGASSPTAVGVSPIPISSDEPGPLTTTSPSFDVPNHLGTPTSGASPAL
jgi:hypothetical protein